MEAQKQIPIQKIADKITFGGWSIMGKKQKTQADSAKEKAYEKARKISNKATATAGGVDPDVVSAGNPELTRETYQAGKDKFGIDAGQDSVEIVKPSESAKKQKKDRK